MHLLSFVRHALMLASFARCLAAEREVSVAQRPEQYHMSSSDSFYTAFGDSYAAGIRALKTLETCPKNSQDGDGPLPPYCTTSTCAKDEGSYPWLLHNKIKSLPPYFDFFACSGATTLDVLDLQIPQLNASSDLITITIGGNNKHAFARVVAQCVYVWGKPGCKGALENARKSVDTIGPDLSKVLGSIRQKNPNAKIIVIGYVQFWPSTDDSSKCQSKSLQRPTFEQKQTMNGLVRDMNKALETAAQGAKAIWTSADAKFDQHRLCDNSDPWIQWKLSDLPGFEDGDDDGISDPMLDLFNKGIFHPSAQGQEAYLDAVSQAAGC